MKRGISLIVLSITILVMAILAATAIIALEDSGIIGRSKNTVKNNNYAEEYTRLTVIKNGILTDNLGTITLEEYITELTNKGIIETTRTDNADGSVTVTTKSGFEVVLSQNGTSDLNIGLEEDIQINDSNNNQNGKIKFYVDGEEFEADEGMSWKAYIDGDYNSLGYFYGGSGFVQYKNNYFILYDGMNVVYSSGLIIPNANYILDPI